MGVQFAVESVSSLVWNTHKGPKKNRIEKIDAGEVALPETRRLSTIYSWLPVPPVLANRFTRAVKEQVAHSLPQEVQVSASGVGAGAGALD
jgi:hypothetical protein